MILLSILYNWVSRGEYISCICSHTIWERKIVSFCGFTRRTTYRQQMQVGYYSDKCPVGHRKYYILLAWVVCTLIYCISHSWEMSLSNFCLLSSPTCIEQKEATSKQSFPLLFKYKLLRWASSVPEVLAFVQLYFMEANPTFENLGIYVYLKSC